ncbi:MAG: acyltransferase [Flavobacteriales bacterium]|nr:acyltransferase [Flavobacteriales bacterium]
MQSRVFGLDLMRAAAILLVVFWHSADVLRAAVPGIVLPPHVDGVDLFFVLSGYLIGGILLRAAALEGEPWHRRLLDFWQRRWLRTLPNYYLFLAVNIALVQAGLNGGVINRNTWIYVVFMQNLYKPVDLFFWESWSLVVEEWFYLLFPILLFSVIALTSLAAKRAYLLLALLFIVAPMLLRFQLAPEAPTLWHMEQGLRKLAITRLDAIGWGILAAWLHACFPSAFRQVRWPMLIVGTAGMLGCAVAYGSERLSFSSTHYFTLNALSMALLLPVLSSWTRAPRWGRGIIFISLVSYALYLVHQPMRYVFNRWFAVEHEAGLFLPLLLYWIACIAMSWLVYRFWERRFMALRAGISRRLGVVPSRS